MQNFMNLGPTQWVVLLSAAAGALHVLAPDHWVPASILGWQRGWGKRKTAIFTLAALLLHVGVGFMIYLVLNHFLSSIDSNQLFYGGVGGVVALALLRAHRFSRHREIIRIGPNRLWGLITVLTLLGPCEAIVPILAKSKHLGIGYLAPGVAFGVGTLLAGMLLILGGRWVWSRPLWLSRAISWAHAQTVALPVIAGMALGLTYLMKV